MDDLYNDLENYDDVEALNRLKTENSDLKQKLECCNVTMLKLQKDFDKLEAEFKILESNYSSLLKISRAEIQRKTDMIRNLNIEKDLLVIKAVQNEPAHKVQGLMRNVREETELKSKNKPWNKVGVPKGREEYIRSKSNSRPQTPATSSTATDNSCKMIGNEKVAGNNTSSRMDTQENQLQNHEVFPDNRPSSPVADKRVSALCRPHFAKLSSDEEFEDMYSALKPKALEKSRKRGRDDSRDGKMLYNSLHDRPLNNPNPFRERFNRNRAGRFSDTERITRGKQHSEPDRNINRGKHHYDRNRNASDWQHHRFSPERHRWGAKDLGDDRYRNRRLESPPRESQRLESPPRERLRLGSPPQESQALRKNIIERRKSYHGRTGNNPEIHSVIHGEYEEPQNKRPRIEPYPVPQEEKMLSEEHYHNESQPPNVGSRTHRSPDFSNAEESSNEPATAQTETRSRTSSVFEDPRVSSDRYVKCSKDNKRLLQSTNANEIYLHPVDKSLWNFEEVQVPKALRSKPIELSEEVVDKIDIDKPLSSISMESGEIRSDTETGLDIYDFREFNKQIGNSFPHIHESQKAENKPHIEKSPVDNNMLEDTEKSSNSLFRETKTKRLKVAKKEKANNHRATESMLSTSKDSQKVDTTMHCDNIKLPSILHKLIHSMNEARPEGENSVKNSKGEKEPKLIAASRISNKSEKSKAKTKDERKNQDEPDLNTDKNKADKLGKGSEKDPKRIAAYGIPNKSDKSGSETRDDRENQNEADLETDNNKTNKLEKGSEKEPKLIVASGISNKSEKPKAKTKDNRKNQDESDLNTDKNKADKLEKGSEKDPKRITAYGIPNKSDKSGSETRDDRENKNESDLETDNNKTDKLEKGSEKEPKLIIASRISNKSEKLKAKTKDDRKNQDESDLNSDKNKADKLEKGSEKDPKRIAAYGIPNKSDKSGSGTRDDRENRNESNLETDNNKTDRLGKGSEKEPKLVPAYRIPKKSEKSDPKTRDDNKNQNESDLETDNNKTNKHGKKSEKVPKQVAAYRIPNRSEKSGPKTRDDRENQNVLDLETDNNKTDNLEKRTDKEPKRTCKLELSSKTEKERVKTTDKMVHKNVPEVKRTDNFEKVTENGTENEIREASLKTNELKHKNVSDVKVEEKPVKGTENNVTVFREFQHRVYSRHIVEGDLELSDESNDEIDEAQLMLEDKIEEKKKISSKSKSHRDTSKDRVNSEEPTRKTRSQKDREKERKPKNKFSELFGDSSSLITPEDLNIATRTAHGLPADCCPPAAEDAQDAIIEPESPLKPQTTEMYSEHFKESLAMSTVEDKFKIKELKDRTRTKHKQYKDDYVEHVGDAKTHVVAITESCLVLEGNLTSNISNYTNQKEVSKLNGKVKESSKSNKRPKTKGEKKLSVSEHTEEINTNNIYISEPNSNNSLTMSDNKENSSSIGNSETNISNETARIFENPIVSSKISSTNASETMERPQLNDSTKETNCSGGVQDVPNLAPVEEEPGLVTTVVISTGVQPLDSNSAQYVTPCSVLASSTPAKDLCAINISSEIESNVTQTHSAQVSVTISRDDSASQSEDVPDMRITCYRRRRRALKK